MKKNGLGLAMMLIFFVACQSGTGQQTSQTTAASGPQVVKIPITSAAQIDSLRNRGIEILVAEEDYVAARLTPSEVITVQDLQLKTEPIKEIELVQRLVRVPDVEKEQLQQLVDLGIDVWEVNGDTLTAQVFDKHIWEIEKLGFTVEIVEHDVRDTAKKAQK
jgi:hypothetical protein